MSVPLADQTKVIWDGFEISAVGASPLAEGSDGTICISSEGRYLVRCDPPNDLPQWQGLQRLSPRAGLLQFVNFIGIAHLGGRPISVWSTRLDKRDVDQMLDDVVARLAALVYTAGSPTSFGYGRTAAALEDVLHHAYVVIRQAVAGRGPHDMRRAMSRILTRPHRELVQVAGVKRLAEADRFDLTSLASLFDSPLESVPQSHPLAANRLAVSLGGRLPTRIRTLRSAETTDNRENGFVANVWRLAADLLRAYAAAVTSRNAAASQSTLAEIEGLLETIDRWQRHPVLAETRPRRSVAFDSAVLRRRLGYRDVTRFFADLQSETNLLSYPEAERLLEARDAALIYEYWCFFQVVDTLSELVGAAPTLQYRFSPFTATVGRGNGVALGEWTVWFNRQYAKRSSSVPLRPDISLTHGAQRLDLFDAKFKHESADWSGDDIDDADETRTYRRGDLYKMHTYRDALDARSVWILYPGKNIDIEHYPAHNAQDGVAGVGAIPLRPGCQEQRAALRDLLATTVMS